MNRIPGRARPESNAAACKNHEERLASRAGRALYLAWCRAGKPFFSPEQSYCLDRGARLGARWARLIVRRHGGVSEWNSFPADAFFAQRPSFRATSLPLPRKENRQSEGGKGKQALENREGFASIDSMAAS